MATRPAILAVSAVMIVAGCTGGSDTDESAAATAAASAAHAAKGRGGAADAQLDYVRAASSGKEGDPIELKFDIPSKPQSGKPIPIDILFVTGPEIERLQATFAAGAGVAFQSGDLPVSFDKLGPDVLARHRIVLKTEKDGIYMVTASVLADAESSSLSRTFSIPIIVGSGVSTP